MTDSTRALLEKALQLPDWRIALDEIRREVDRVWDADFTTR